MGSWKGRNEVLFEWEVGRAEMKSCLGGSLVWVGSWKSRNEVMFGWVCKEELLL